MDYPNFQGIVHFKAASRADNWGDASKISRSLLLELDKLRNLVGSPIFVTSGYREKPLFGITHSQHMQGRAVDIVCPSKPLNILLTVAETLAFTGIGAYPDWSWNGKKCGGLHLDVRETKRRAQWMGITDPIHGEVYIALDEINKKHYGVI